MAAFANTAAALSAAQAAAASGIPYSTAVQQSGLLAGFRADCSGLADYVLAAAGVNVGSETTVGLASDPNLKRGQGSITLWDIPQPGQSGHVIEDISGSWFESGGMTGGGPHAMTPAQAAQELGVSSLTNLGSGPTPRGFVALTPSAGSSSNSLASLWVQAGGPANVANIMAAIAMAESGGQTGATNNNTNGTTDRGLWQINSSHSQFNAQQLLTDPLYNAQAAVSVYRSQGLTAWTTYTSGAYKQFLNTQSRDVIQGSGPNGGKVRPGGQPSGSSSADGGTTAWTSYETELSSWGTTGQPSAGSSSQFVGFNLGKALTQNGGPFFFNPLSIFQEAQSSISDATTFLQWIGWLFHPRNILRAVEFLTGLALMAFSFQAMLQGIGERREGYSTGESALSRSGIGRVSKELSRAIPEARVAQAARSIAPAPHRTRRTALRVRYERERQVARRQSSDRRSR